MPGSHDAGMSAINGPTPVSNKQNTQTQNLDFSGQLAQGARYFDLRPVIAGGHYAAGHYSNIAGIWQGATGQSIQDIIVQINNYLDKNRELVVLELTADHMYDTDHGYNLFNSDQWNGLFKLMSGLKHLYVAPKGTTDLTRLSLKSFIASSGAVIVVVRGYNNLGSYANNGFYTGSQYPMYNNYSNTDSDDDMRHDQISKMQTQRASPDSDPFLLSWTLTLQLGTSIGIVGSSIIDLAQRVLPELYGTPAEPTAGVWSFMNKNTYPNVILIDAWPNDQRVTDLCMAVNRYFNPGCNGH
jgi:hypothetical protein